MFFALTLAAGFTALVCGLLLLVGLAALQVGALQRMSLDDATTLLYVVWAVGAAVFATWAPRSKVAWLVTSSARYRKAVSVTAALLSLFALYWGGYFIERQFDESVHRASWLTFVISLAGALAVYVYDAPTSRSHSNRSSL